MAALYCAELSTFVASFAINAENVDFFWSVLEFWLNVTIESKNLTLDSI